MTNKGFIKLSRKYFDNPLWKENRTYSRSEAWLDLIGSALIDDLKVFIKGQDIEVQRGEIAASRRFLEKRWGWGSTKVTNFLGYLIKNGMITTRKTNGQTIITLVNYGVYNNYKPPNKPGTNQRQTKIKELQERKDIFYKQVIEYESKFQKEMLVNFFDYWSEHKEKGRKMRFEMQRTWNLKLRLDKWLSNQKKWNQTKNIKVNGATEIKQQTINRQTAEVIEQNSTGWGS